MRLNLIKKVVVGGLITSLCLCCCFLNFNNNVIASSINEYQEENKWFENATFLPNNITDINDLKGKTFTLSTYLLLGLQNLSQYDLYINILERDYIGVEINEETHETIQCIDYLQYPYIIYEYLDDSSSNNDFNIFSFYLESDDNYSFFYINDIAFNSNSTLQMQGCLLSKKNNFAYLPLENLVEKDDVPLGFYNTLYQNGIVYYLNYSNRDFLNEEEFLTDINYRGISYQYLNFYIVFPNTDRYTLSISPSYLLSQTKFFNYIQPYNANIEDRQLSYNNGYNNGYYVGQRDALDNTYRIPFLTGIFNAVSDILALEIFPNVRLGYFVLIPLALGVTGMIFWFWRKD